jgi:hypothetical protein
VLQWYVWYVCIGKKYVRTCRKTGANRERAEGFEARSNKNPAFLSHFYFTILIIILFRIIYTCTMASPQQSPSIPISVNGMRRTPSELQLCIDEEIADYRDYLFYHRLVQGITKQCTCQNPFFGYQNQICLAHIEKTRHDEHSAYSNRFMTPPRLNHSNAADHMEFLKSVTTCLLCEIQDEEDDDIFDMEL